MNLSDLKIEHKLINDALIKDRANKDHFLQELDDVQKTSKIMKILKRQVKRVLYF